MTLVDGSLRARGVAGRGGRIETSGHVLGVQGRVDAGEGGQWLLDPVDLTIGLNGVAVGGGTTSPGASVSVNATSIMNALNAGSSVTLLTSGGSGGGGHIMIMASVVKTAGAAATLTLLADGDLYVQSGVDLADGGAGLSLVLRAGGSIEHWGNIATTGSVLIDAGLDVFLYGPIQSTGPVSVLGRGITVSSLGISVTGADAPLLLQADRSITLSGYQTLETNGGDITLWANSAGQGGAIRVGDFTSLLSHGGDITLAGGMTGPDGLPAGYAVGAAHLEYSEDTIGVRLGTSYGDAVGISIESSGGDIVIRGQGGPTDGMNLMAVGVLANSGVSILSGTGTVLIDGVGGTGGGTAAAHGVEFNAYASATSHAGTTIESADTTVDAIRIMGDARPSSQDDRQGIQVSKGSPFRVTASGMGGGITLSGETNSSASWARGLRLDTAMLLARSGPITLVSRGRAMDLVNVVLGALPGSSIGTSSADITILTDTLNLVGQFSTLDTTGMLTISPVSASFDSALTWPDAMLHFNRMPGGLELGKSGNLAALNIVSDLLIDGPILLQAGAITISARVEALSAGSVQIEANGPLVIGPQGSVWTHDSDIDIRARRLVNQAGASALQPLGSGRWLLWSENPDPFSVDVAVADQRGGLVFDFKQYGFSDAGVVLGSGNGLLFSHQPMLGVMLAGVVSKVYDGTATAALTPANLMIGGGVDGDTVQPSVAANGVYVLPDGSPTKAVGTNQLVQVSGLGLGSVAVSSAATGAKPVYGYDVGSGGTVTAAIGVITPRALVVSGVTVVDKVYDGGVTATVSTAGQRQSGVVAGDDVTVGVTGQFTDKQAGAGKAVVLSGNVSGLDASNYSLTMPTGLTATITPRALLVSGVTVVDKVYDGGVTATVNTAGQRQSGVVAGDDVTVGVTGQFTDKQAGAGKAVVLSASASGTDAGNYSVVVPTGLTATVTPRPVQPTGLTAQDRVYDGTVGVTLTGTPTVGGLAGDQLSIAGTPVGTFADPAVGASKPVSVAGLVLRGADASNYTLVSSRLLTATVQAVMPPPVVGVASRSEVSPTRTTAQAMLAPAIEVAMEITVGDVSLTGASANLGESETATTAQEEPTVTAKPAAAAPPPPAVAAAPAPAVTTPPTVTTASTPSATSVGASPAVAVGTPPGPAGTAATERSTRTPTGRSPGVAAVPVPMPERPRPAQDTTAAAPSARPTRAPEALSLSDIAGGAQSGQALDRITSAWSAQAIAQGLPAEQVQAVAALYGASVTQLMARGVPPDKASAQAAEILAASRPGTPGAPDFSGGSTAGTTLDQLAAKQVAMAVARGVPQAQARATAQTYTRSVAQLMARGVPPALAVAQASAAMPLSVNPPRGNASGGSASDLMASSPSDGGRAAVTRLAQAASPQGEQVFGRALGAAVMAGNNLEEAVKVAREAAQEQARLARVDQSMTGALTGAGPRALIDGQPRSVSRGLGNLLASGLPLEKAGQALHELQQVMSGYAKVEARDEAARLAVPLSPTDQPVGPQDPLLQKARIVRLQQRSTADEAPVSPDELARVLAEPQPTALTAVASGRHVAGQITSPGNSRIFNRVLSAELLKGIAPDQALRTARRAEQDMALRIPLPARAVTFLTRHARAEFSVGMEGDQPLPAWMQFDRTTGSVLLHDVPPDGARVRVVLRAAGERISLDIGEITTAPTSPGTAGHRP